MAVPMTEPLLSVEDSTAPPVSDVMGAVTEPVAEPPLVTGTVVAVAREVPEGTMEVQPLGRTAVV